MALSAVEPPEGEGEEVEPTTTGPDSVIAVLTLDATVSQSLSGLFDTNSKGVVDGLTHAMYRTLNARDRLLDSVIALDPEAAGADYADGMADTVDGYADEVATLTEALADDRCRRRPQGPDQGAHPGPGHERQGRRRLRRRRVGPSGHPPQRRRPRVGGAHGGGARERVQERRGREALALAHGQHGGLEGGLDARDGHEADAGDGVALRPPTRGAARCRPRPRRRAARARRSARRSRRTSGEDPRRGRSRRRRCGRRGWRRAGARSPARARAARARSTGASACG